MSAHSKVIVMLGAPGAGKGTQARQLSTKFSWPQISTGDILRAMAKVDSPLGKEIQKIQSMGKLVSDEILLQVVLERISQPDCVHGFILDGYPRTLKQAEQLESIIENQQRDLLIVNIDVDTDTLMKRLTGRRTCSNCGELYNVYFKPSCQIAICDKCNGTLTQRSDDKEEVIAKRLEEYSNNTAPLIEYYSTTNRLITLDGVENEGKVFDTLCQLVS